MMWSRIAPTAAGIALAAAVGASDWPAFRGPAASGVADGAGLPSRWSVETGENVRWSTPIPGTGHSSPIVSGRRVFVTTAVAPEAPDLALGDSGGISMSDDAVQHSWRVISIDAHDGRILWSREAFAGVPRSKRHVKSSQANATPATDGRTVVAIFASQGIVAYDVDGDEKWRADLGTNNPGLFGSPDSEWGAASSPVVHSGRVYVQVDRHQDSFLAALDLDTGAELWRVARDERPVWSTPTVHVGDAGSELIVRGGYYDRAYDPATGAELWRFADDAEVKTPTAFVSDGLILLTGGYRGRPMIALRAGGRGDLSLPDGATSSDAVAWKSEVGGPYTSTPVAYDGLLYAVRDEGILQVHDLASGELVHRQRTDATHSASLVASDGRIFVTSEDGEVLVYRAGREPELLARNPMGEVCMATPAISGDALYVRTVGHVHAIASAGSGLDSP